jgi:hypothetical protein
LALSHGLSTRPDAFANVARGTSCAKGDCRVTERAGVKIWQRAASCAGGSCVELAAFEGSVAVRDSKDPESPILTFTRDEWIAFADALRRGEFDDLL